MLNDGKSQTFSNNITGRRHVLAPKLNLQFYETHRTQHPWLFVIGLEVHTPVTLENCFSIKSWRVS